MPAFTVHVKEKHPAAVPFTVVVNSSTIHTQAEAEAHVAATSGTRLDVVPAAPAAEVKE